MHIIFLFCRTFYSIHLPLLSRKLNRYLFYVMCKFYFNFLIIHQALFHPFFFLHLLVACKILLWSDKAVTCTFLCFYIRSDSSATVVLLHRLPSSTLITIPYAILVLICTSTAVDPGLGKYFLSCFGEKFTNRNSRALECSLSTPNC